MPRKRHKPEEIVAKLRQVDEFVSQGQSVADAVRAIGVTEVRHRAIERYPTLAPSGVFPDQRDLAAHRSLEGHYPQVSAHRQR
jgi:hypothetical protein